MSSRRRRRRRRSTSRRRAKRSGRRRSYSLEIPADDESDPSLMIRFIAIESIATPNHVPCQPE
jgi:hypothetical protein